jgi:hypothetical protein
MTPFNTWGGLSSLLPGFARRTANSTHCFMTPDSSFSA